jgi:hypothetical protein
VETPDRTGTEQRIVHRAAGARWKQAAGKSYCEVIRQKCFIKTLNKGLSKKSEGRRQKCLIVKILTKPNF